LGHPDEFVEDEAPRPGMPDDTDMNIFYGATWFAIKQCVLRAGRYHA